MSIISQSPSNTPCSINYHYGDSYDTEVVLGKLKTGEVFTIYANVNEEDRKVTWHYTGKDRYTLAKEDLECWAYIPEKWIPIL